MNKLIISIPILLIIAGCISNTPKSAPDWIFKPQNGVAVSTGRHIDGIHAQEKLAISRAREEFALSLKVDVESVTVMDSSITDSSSKTGSSILRNSTSNRTLKTNSTLTTNVSVIKTRVKEKWYDQDSGRLWIWLTPF